MHGLIITMQTQTHLRPSQPMDCLATVLSSIALTPTIHAIRLRLNAPEFQFLPGQSIWPRFQREGKAFTKIYSMSSSPTCSPEVELCVSRVGWSSAHMQDLRPGDTIPVRGPYGMMTLETLPVAPRLYIAEGSGIGPLKSHIDWLYDCRCDQPIYLVQANPETPEQLPYRDEWRSLQARWPQFHYVEAIALSPEQALLPLPLALAEVDVDICAVGDRPNQLCDAVLALGAKSHRVRSEAFVAF